MSETKLIGLIAGADRLPVIVAKGMKANGFRVICVGLENNVNPELREIVDVYESIRLAAFGGWIRKLRKHGVSRTVMVGKVEKRRVYTPFRLVQFLPDWRALRIWYWRLRNMDKRGDSLLRAVADELASGGITLENSTMFNQDDLAVPGNMTKRSPGSSMLGDIEFGVMIARLIGHADIGQAVTVKEKETIAVEAIDGTARMLERTGELCGKGWTLIKVSKPEQDMRFDVPCIGVETVRSVASLGGVCIAVEAGKTFLIDKEATLALADEKGVIIYGITAGTD